jgi:hypothetical protein
MLLKPRKNKSFSYTPRFSKDKENNTNKEETSKVGDLSSKWRNNQGLGNRKPKKGLPLYLLILVLVLVLICMYFLDIKSK